MILPRKLRAFESNPISDALAMLAGHEDARKAAIARLHQFGSDVLGVWDGGADDATTRARIRAMHRKLLVDLLDLVPSTPRAERGAA